MTFSKVKVSPPTPKKRLSTLSNKSTAESNLLQLTNQLQPPPVPSLTVAMQSWRDSRLEEVAVPQMLDLQGRDMVSRFIKFGDSFQLASEILRAARNSSGQIAQPLIFGKAKELKSLGALPRNHFSTYWVNIRSCGEHAKQLENISKRFQFLRSSNILPRNIGAFDPYIGLQLWQQSQRSTTSSTFSQESWMLYSLSEQEILGALGTTETPLSQSIAKSAPLFVNQSVHTFYGPAIPLNKFITSIEGSFVDEEDTSQEETFADLLKKLPPLTFLPAYELTTPPDVLKIAPIVAFDKNVSIVYDDHFQSLFIEYAKAQNHQDSEKLIAFDDFRSFCDQPTIPLRAVRTGSMDIKPKATDNPTLHSLLVPKDPSSKETPIDVRTLTLRSNLRYRYANPFTAERLFVNLRDEGNVTLLKTVFVSQNKASRVAHLQRVLQNLTFCTQFLTFLLYDCSHTSSDNLISPTIPISQVATSTFHFNYNSETFNKKSSVSDIANVRLFKTVWSASPTNSITHPISTTGEKNNFKEFSSLRFERNITHYGDLCASHQSQISSLLFYDPYLAPIGKQHYQTLNHFNDMSGNIKSSFVVLEEGVSAITLGIRCSRSGRILLRGQKDTHFFWLLSVAAQQRVAIETLEQLASREESAKKYSAAARGRIANTRQRLRYNNHHQGALKPIIYWTTLDALLEDQRSPTPQVAHGMTAYFYLRSLYIPPVTKNPSSVKVTAEQSRPNHQVSSHTLHITIDPRVSDEPSAAAPNQTPTDPPAHVCLKCDQYKIWEIHHDLLRHVDSFLESSVNQLGGCQTIDSAMEARKANNTNDTKWTLTGTYVLHYSLVMVQLRAPQGYEPAFPSFLANEI